MTETTMTEPETPPPAAKRIGTRTRALIALAALIVVGGVVAVIVWSRSDSGPAHHPAPTLAPGKLLGASALQLATLLTDARDHTFHARYDVQGNAKIIGGSLQMEWWNKPGHSRVDTTRTRDGKVVRTASIVNGDQGVGCQKVGSAAWTCQKIDVPAPGDPGGMVSTITAELAGRPVSEHDTKVAGHAARCFHVSGGTEPIDVCTDSRGVLLRNASAQVRYEIAALDSDVPDSVFTAPAPVR
jgi:hypothetical protein